MVFGRRPERRRMMKRFSGMAMVLVLASMSAQGFLIDFNSPGYSTGDLNGQGATATKWNGGSATIQVVTDPQDSGNQVVQTQYSASPNNSEWVVFNTSDADLGFTLNKVDGTADFSFKVRRDSTGGGTRNMVFYVGYLEATDGRLGYFSIYGNGTFQYSYGGGATYFNDVPTASWTQVSGHVDYSTSMVTYTQDGTDLGSYAFKSPKADTGAGWAIYTQNAQYGIQVAMDDFSFVPEPATIGLLMLGGMLLRRRSA
jgi:hypothetical protein